MAVVGSCLAIRGTVVRGGLWFGFVAQVAVHCRVCALRTPLGKHVRRSEEVRNAITPPPPTPVRVPLK